MVVFDLGTRSVPGRVELTPMMSSRGVLTIKVQEIFVFGRRMKHSLKTISWKFNTAPKIGNPERKYKVFQSLFIRGYVKLPECNSLMCPQKIDGLEDEVSCFEMVPSKNRRTREMFFLFSPCVGGESCSACTC